MKLLQFAGALLLPLVFACSVESEMSPSGGSGSTSPDASASGDPTSFSDMTTEELAAKVDAAQQGAAEPADATPEQDEPRERTAGVVLAEAAEVIRQIPRYDPDKAEQPEYEEEYANQIRELAQQYIDLTTEAYELEPDRPIVLMLLQRRWMMMCAELEDSETAVAEMKGVLHKYIADEVARLEAIPELPSIEDIETPEVDPSNPQMRQPPDTTERLAQLKAELEELEGAAFPFDVEATLSWDLQNEVRYALCMAHLGRLKLASMTGTEHTESDYLEVRTSAERFVEQRPFDSRGASVFFELGDHYSMGGNEEKQRELLARILTLFPTRDDAVIKAKAQLRRMDTVGKPFPPLVFHDVLSGDTVDTSSFAATDDAAGKIVVIYFWATWSGHCAEDIKRMNAFDKESGEDIQFIGVSLDEPRDRNGLTDLKEFVTTHEIDWPQFYEGQKWGGNYNREWGVDRIPFAFVIDRDGTLAVTDPRADLVETLQSMLGE